MLKQKRKVAEQILGSLPNPCLKYGASVMMDTSTLNLAAINPGPGELTVKAPKEVIIMPLEKSDKESLTGLFSIFPQNKDKLTALHAARWQNGLLIIIPKNANVSIKISSKSKTDAIQHLLITVEQNAKACITYETQADQFFSGAIELFAKRNAIVEVTRTLRGKSSSFDYKIAKLDEASSVKWIDCYTNCTFLRSETISLLSGRESNASIKTIFMGKKFDQLDIEASAIHNAPNTTSEIQAKGVLENSSKNIYRGLIHMTASAENSTGKQKEEVLILSEAAEASSIPKLVIDNNNVKCAHAASIGHIDAEKLFYLQSRGLSDAAARQTIVDGFLEPIKNQLNPDVILQ